MDEDAELGVQIPFGAGALIQRGPVGFVVRIGGEGAGLEDGRKAQRQQLAEREGAAELFHSVQGALPKQVDAPVH